MKICEYGCGQEALFPPRKGMNKWCCESHYNKCIFQKNLKANIIRKNGKLKGRNPWNKGKIGVQTAWNKGLKNCWSKEIIEKANRKRKLSLKKIKERYPFFCKMEEIKKSNQTGKFLVHCKNHKCENSKEQGGWFIPSYIQLYERIRALEQWGKDYNYFYCSTECKESCEIYRKKESEIIGTIIYTQSEYRIFRQFVLERDNYKC